MEVGFSTSPAEELGTSLSFWNYLGWALAWKLALVHVPLVQEIFGLRKKIVRPKPENRRRLSKFYGSTNSASQSCNSPMLCARSSLKNVVTPSGSRLLGFDAMDMLSSKIESRRGAAVSSACQQVLEADEAPRRDRRHRQINEAEVGRARAGSSSTEYRDPRDWSGVELLRRDLINQQDKAISAPETRSAEGDSESLGRHEGHIDTSRLEQPSAHQRLR
ncbi:hypothetical protein SAY86_021586 [Trapa natans]|uniref:Uncharacterized protein n=1 Tax=Trapa natans TaxID=22666 RepID=A0AAN7M8Z1_TRANT|nr:hypothetical protein SAY86_021586 [Trapa natans]